MSYQEPTDDAARIQASLDSLAKGGLPLRAQERIARRLAEPGGFTSDLSVNEFAAIKSVGFEPVSQVMGSSVYQIGWSGVCPAAGTWGSFSTVELTGYSDAMTRARWLALNRLSQEAHGVGGHGVVGLHLNWRWVDPGARLMEFTAIGTAVRRAGAAPLNYPFLSSLSGQDFAKLLRSGYIPCALVMGISAYQIHSGYRSRYQAQSWQNQEVDQFTQAVGAARHAAMFRLHHEMSTYGATGCVSSKIGLEVSEAPCYYYSGSEREELEDKIVQFYAVSTAVVRYTNELEPDRPQILKRLDDVGSNVEIEI